MIDHSPEMVDGSPNRMLIQPTFQSVSHSLLPMTTQRMQNHDAHAAAPAAAHTTHYGRQPAPVSGPAIHVVALPATACDAKAAQAKVSTATAAKGCGSAANGAHAQCSGSVSYARSSGVCVAGAGTPGHDRMLGEATTMQTSTNSGSSHAGIGGRRDRRGCVDPQEAKLLVKTFKLDIGRVLARGLNR